MATIRIGRSDSRCVECKKSANPNENGHITNLGYNMKVNGTPGCGEPWTAVEIEYGVMLPTEPPQFKPDIGFVFENLRGLPMVGFYSCEGMVYPNDEQLTFRR